ncbi:MFS transporter [Chloropicon primus]|uniref:MFS transporter n=1 Tax=Chloropicon primus TaxID=1764295 RepID=A0A5B8MPM1_9CHLO|nr:MFS transporter [Chloropicon primus]|eukprot:QDZ22426.1 MFS transporter [Chloropicon primus]
MKRVDSNNGKIKWKALSSRVLGESEERKPTKVGLKLARRFGSRYAYAIVLIGTLTKALSACGQTTFLGGVLDYIEADLGVKRSTTSVLYSSATLLSASTLPGLGWAMDRLGLRWAGMLNATLMGLVCIVLGSIASEPVLLTVFFYLLRFLGQGGMQLIGTNLISNWWIQKRGLMQGISGVGLSLSMTGVFPVLARVSCENIGWRLTFAAIGTFVLVFFVPLCSVFFLETPEMYSLRADAARGASGDDDAADRPSKERELEGKTLREALRTLDFYAVTLGCSVWAFNATGVFFHLIVILQTDLRADTKVMDSVVPHVYLTCAITSSVFTLVIGYLFDRANPKWIISAALVLQSLSIFLFSVSRSVPVTILSAFVFGVSNGCMNNMSGVVHAYLFGRKHLGKISGLGYSSMVVGSALGPLPLGLVQSNNLKQQTMVMYALCVPPIVGAFFALICKMKPLVPRNKAGKGTATPPREDVEMQHLLKEIEEEADDSGDDDGEWEEE